MDTVIPFGPSAVGLHTSIEHQYHSLGVDFGDYPPYNALPVSSQIPGGMSFNVPIAVAAPAGVTGPQVAQLITPTEFVKAGAFGTFSGFHRHVKATVGSTDKCTVTLTAYDINGKSLASASGKVGSGLPPVSLDAVSTSAKPDIIYFLIQADQYNMPIWMAELSFDPSVSTADFAWLTTPFFSLSQGHSATEVLKLNRIGNSNGNIQFAATGLPANVTASFSPNPATGVEDSTSLTLTAAANAGVVSNANFKVSATPAGAAVGPQPRAATGQVNVLLPFYLWTDNPSLNILPCTPLAIQPLTIVFNPGFAGTVSLSITGLPPNASYTITPPTMTSSGPVGAEVLVSGGLTKATTIQVNAKSGALVSSVSIALQPISASITTSPSGAMPPRALTPGATIVITGTGFCPGSTVRFGNDLAVATPVSITPTTIKAVVPRFATTGLATASPFPFGVIPPGGTSANLIPAKSLCLINSTRNSLGFSFMNFDYGAVTMSQVEELYGNSGGAAKVFCGAAQLFVQTGKDVCFGICLSTQRLIQDNTGALAASFPPNSPYIDAFGLHGPDVTQNVSGASAPLQDYIRSQHLAQLSEEYLGAYLTFAVHNANSSSAVIRQAIASCLQRTIGSIAAPDYPLVAMRQGIGSGHVVVAYDIVG
jgi:IPT/TIG domain